MTATVNDFLKLAAAGWAVFPLIPGGKTPAIPSAHPDGLPCRGECGRDGHGFLDATRDPARIAARCMRYPGANIGIALPEHLFVADVDPRHDGDVTLAQLEERHGALPETLTQATGGAGQHLIFGHPGGHLRSPGPGIDPRLGGKHYLVGAPSYVQQPPESKGSGHYRWVDPDVPVAPMPEWLVALMRPPTPSIARNCGNRKSTCERPGDRFNATTTWAQILEPAGWIPIAQRGDVTHWCRPGKRRRSTSAVTGGREDLLFVFSTCAAPLECERPYDRFGAWVALAHNGDFSAAARALRVAS